MKPRGEKRRGSGSTTSARSTVSGPARKAGRGGGALAEKRDATDGLVAAMPFNPTKAGEYGKRGAQPVVSVASRHCKIA